jgi:NADPH:quinone reductase-like Zn-dependent oxidoreductase
VSASARDGSGPQVGARVVGLARQGAWAQRAAVSTRRLATIPDGVSFAQAAALPVAGMTALRALALGGSLLGSRVLITGAAGGVGRFAVQLAARGGASVGAVVGRSERAEGLAALGAERVMVGTGPADGEYDLVLESVGGASLGYALEHVAPEGTVVSFGNSSQEPTTFSASAFYGRSGARLYGLVLVRELERNNSGVQDLAYLSSLVGANELDPQIGLETTWREPGPAMRALLERKVAGKAVLLLE